MPGDKHVALHDSPKLLESRALGEDPADLLHEMIGFAAARLMEGGLTGAAWSENGPDGSISATATPVWSSPAAKPFMHPAALGLVASLGQPGTRHRREAFSAACWDDDESWSPARDRS